jgi:hypothetical protein
MIKETMGKKIKNSLRVPKLIQIWSRLPFYYKTTLLKIMIQGEIAFNFHPRRQRVKNMNIYLIN